MNHTVDCRTHTSSSRRAVARPLTHSLLRVLLQIGGALLCSLALIGPASAAHPAQELVIGTVDKVLAEARGQADSDTVAARIEDLVVPHLDFEAMTKLSVGKHWRKANATQRDSLITEFRTFLLNTYRSAIDEYKGGSIEFEPFKPASRDDRAVVRSKFTQSGSAAVPVVYKLRDKGGWKIYDIEVSKLSLVTNYRASFSAEIEKNGVDGLIGLLKERNGKAG